METIEQAAKEYADRYFEERLGNCGARNGFVAGVAFAQEWIPIEKSLPKEGITVLIKDKNGYIGLSCIRYGEWDYNFKNTITHWRLINKI